MNILFFVIDQVLSLVNLPGETNLITSARHSANTICNIFKL